MEPRRQNAEHVAIWLVRCLDDTRPTVSSARHLRIGPEREVWDCTFTTGGKELAAIVVVFRHGSLESVNTSLPPRQVARKCALAMAELPALGIPTPALLGCAESDGEAALVSERIDRAEWRPHVRVQAARVLARIHRLAERELSKPLRELVRRSDPREERTTGGRGPKCALRTLVHGDYFSANILPTADGLRVIDWETFGYGDPMWDLGFLIGADRNLPADEVEAVVREYESLAPVVHRCLTWHRQRWSDYWKHRDQASGSNAREAT
ncbi:MAG: phosphotransferase [Armatimonadetes bacterium]|nr:phosphotransferase [Armatimonadota bacterium]